MTRAKSGAAKPKATQANLREKATLRGLRIRNYRALADVGIGQVEYGKGTALPHLACFIGRNGCGKSTLLDALGFLADCLTEGAESACDKPHRGGFQRIRTQGAADPIQFELFFDAGDPERPIAYKLAIDRVKDVPIVLEESLRQRRSAETVGKPYHFLKLKNGAGKVWSGTYDEDDADKGSEKVSLPDKTQLGIATFGNLSNHPRVVSVRNTIEQWYLSYFVPDAARALPPSGAQRWLDRTGSNLGNVLQYYQRQYPDRFNGILEQVSKAIPGLKKIEAKPGEDGRLLLKFDERGYADPFFQQSMSDGTLKMAAYSVLLADPQPRPLIGIEEPENGLYVELLEALASQLLSYAAKSETSTQILVTTHSPYFVDALRPEHVWVLKKDESGHTTAQRAADMPQVVDMTNEGLTLGALWYSRHLGTEG